MSCQTLNDCLSFATHLLELTAFTHTMSNMTTKLVIYGLINLRISSSDYTTLLIFVNLVDWTLVTMWSFHLLMIEAYELP
jgi:hypothetical protein